MLRFLRSLERRTDQSIERSAHASTSPLAMIYSDMAYKDRLILGKRTLKQIGFWDDLARLCTKLHEKGLTVIFHSDGNVMDVVDELVAAGIDGLNPLEKAAGMDVYALRRRYPQLTLVGGVDVTHLLPFGTPEEVRKETRRMIDELGSEGHLLIGSSTELGDDVPLANYLALWDEVMRGECAGRGESHRRDRLGCVGWVSAGSGAWHDGHRVRRNPTAALGHRKRKEDVDAGAPRYPALFRLSRAAI